MVLSYATIVNRGESLKQRLKIYVGRFMSLHNLLFFVHTLCTSYVIKAFLFVNSSVSSEQLLCFVHGQGRKREQKT